MSVVKFSIASSLKIQIQFLPVIFISFSHMVTSEALFGNVLTVYSPIQIENIFSIKLYIIYMLCHKTLVTNIEVLAYMILVQIISI